MKRRRALAMACLAVLAATIAAAGGSAGNRDGKARFEPLTAIVTYGQEFAYGAELDNINDSGSVFTHVTFTQTRPFATIGGVTYAAALDKASCDGIIDDKGDGDPRNDELTCEFGTLRPEDAPIRVTILWKALAIPGSPNCDPTPQAPCLTTTGTWLIKEGKPTNSNETFAFPTKVGLLGGDGTLEDKRAGGYKTAGTGAAACTAAAGDLHTNQSLTNANSVSTTVCLPIFTLPDGSIDFGYAAAIVESFTQQYPSAHPELGQSDVCVAALGQNCGTGHIPVNWGTQRARQIFRILDSAITTTPKQITQVTHNGVPLPSCSGPKGDPNFVQGCVVTIVQPTGNPTTGNPDFWIVVVDAPNNGPYGF